MKLVQEYYHLQDLPKKLAKRWARPDLCEQDFLRWGATGQLQFSILLTNYCNEYYSDKECIELTPRDFLRNPQGDPKDMTKPSDNNKNIIKITKKAVEKFLDNEQHQISGRDTIIAHYKRFQTTPESGSTTPSKIYCKKYDLIVTSADILSFEKNESIREEEKPIYLRETEVGYNSELALAIEVWNALFVEKQFIEEKTAKKAAIKYIEDKYGEFEGSAESGTGIHGRIVVMMNKGLRTKAWSFFKKKNEK